MRYRWPLAVRWAADSVRLKVCRRLPARLVIATFLLFLASAFGLLAFSSALSKASGEKWLRNSQPLKVNNITGWLELPEKVFWSFSLHQLQHHLDLRLEDFKLADISHPQSARRRRHSDSLRSEVFAAGLPAVTPGTDAEWIRLNEELDLLDRRPYSEYSDWTSSQSDCKVIIFTASPAKRNENIIHSHFNHRVYAEKHRACLLHLTCRVPRDNTESRNNSMDFYHQAFEEALGKLPESLIHIPSDGGCNTWANPYFWKFVAFYKLLEMLRHDRHDRLLMYIDEDILFTNSAVSPYDLQDANRPNTFIIGTDFLTIQPVPVVLVPSVTLPLNTGAMLSNSYSRITAAIVTETLLFPYTRRSELADSIRRYWDTDQGVLTYLLDKDLGLNMTNIRVRMEDDAALTRATAQRAPLVTQAVGDALVVVVPQKVLASVPREPLGSEGFRSDLAFAAEDWMVHLMPGLPHLKLPAWKTVCEKYRETVATMREACWWSMDELRM